MSEPRTGGPSPHPGSQEGRRLDSWKKIAAHFKRDVSTVQRWERREAMPVHRHLHDKQGSVYAFSTELDVWWASRRSALAHDDDAADVQPVHPPEAAEAAESRPLRIRGERSLRWVIGMGAIALLLGTVLWVAAEAGFFWRNPLANAKFTRLTDQTVMEQAAAISRDGKAVAFLADRDGQTDAWFTEVGSGMYRNLTHGNIRELVNPSIRTLGFSADGSLVTIWTRKADGSRSGDINIVAEPTAGGPLQDYLPEAAEVSWSSDGKRAVYHTTAPGDPLFVRESGQPGARRIYVAPAGVHCHFPVWSADDEFIYFVRGVPPDAWDVWRIQPSGSNLERITFHNSLVSHPVLLDRRTLVYLASDAHGSGPWLYATDVVRRVPHRISFGLERYTSLAASADGARLVATVANTKASLWSVSLSEELAGRSKPVRISSGSAAGVSPRAGPNYLLYESWRGDGHGIWKLENGAAGELWSEEHSNIVGAPAISPDGRRIAFTVASSDKTLLYVMESDGTHARVVTDSLNLRGSPAWNPDGQSVTSAVLREGEPRLTTISLNGNPPLQLVSEYSIDPVWSPDGQFLIYSGADVGTTFPLRAVARDGRPYQLPTLILTRGARRVVFWRDGHAIVVLRGEIGRKNFWLVDLQSGTERQLTDFASDIVIRDFDLSPDGKEILFDRIEDNSEIALIERPR